MSPACSSSLPVAYASWSAPGQYLSPFPRLLEVSASPSPTASHLADVVGYDIPSESKHARALERGKSERVDALLADPEVDQILAGRVGGVTALLIPLIFHERAIGIISAFNKSGS